MLRQRCTGIILVIFGGIILAEKPCPHCKEVGTTPDNLAEGASEEEIMLHRQLSTSCVGINIIELGGDSVATILDNLEGLNEM